MIRRAFAAHTDTRETWGILQRTCLIRQEEEAESSPHQSILLQRLGLAESAAEEKAPTTGLSPPAVDVVEKPLIRPSKEIEDQRLQPQAPLYSLVVESSGRRIALPTEGELALGRLDPQIGIAPDIDLTFEDKNTLTVSRRHAKVYGADGQHFIEDLGSTNGTQINGKPLALGVKHRLQPGDHIRLGHCQLVYGVTPARILAPPHHPPPRFSLLVAFTGHRIPLPDKGRLVIGRSDPKTGFIPDIDLAPEGEAATNVSRRHVKLYFLDNKHLIEDLGSAGGTKVNGERLELGQVVQLKPGDHIWLSGCVLAYDIDVTTHRSGGSRGRSG
ncbi:MAG: FHA domain-containing protein [Anaerolineae bacterium]